MGGPILLLTRFLHQEGDLPRVPRASRPRYQIPLAPRSALPKERMPARTRLLPPEPQRPRRPPARKSTLHLQPSLLLTGIGMASVLVILFFGQLFGSWFTRLNDNLQYGYPRTYQTDAFVGHEKGRIPSHFIAINLHGQIEIIELPGGDENHIYRYSGPQLYTKDADLLPVTLHFVDMHHNHHPDMIVEIGTTQIIYQNLPNGFRQT